MAAPQFFDKAALALAAGNSTVTKPIFRNGHQTGLTAGTETTVWNIPSTSYPWSAWATAGSLTIPAVSEADNGKKLTIMGLDTGFNLQIDEVTLSSVTDTFTTTTWARADRFFQSSGATNEGDITIKKGDVLVGLIGAGEGQNNAAVYTIPVGHTGYVMWGMASVKSGGARLTMKVDYGGVGAWRNAGIDYIHSGHNFSTSYPLPLPVAAKSDLEISMLCDEDTSASASFQLLIVKDGS